MTGLVVPSAATGMPHRLRPVSTSAATSTSTTSSSSLLPRISARRSASLAFFAALLFCSTSLAASAAGEGGDAAAAADVRGRSLSLQGRHPEALAAFREARSLKPGKPVYLNNLCVAALSGGQSEAEAGRLGAAMELMAEAEAACGKAVRIYAKRIKTKNKNNEKAAKKAARKVAETKINLERVKLERTRLAQESRGKQLFELEIPRVTRAELAANATLQLGHWPFVVTDATSGWPAMGRWAEGGPALTYLKSLIPDQWVDFYPENMYNTGNKPYLYRFREALERWRTPKERDMGKPRYMQMRLTLDAWEALRADLNYEDRDAYLPEQMWTEADWIHDESTCMENNRSLIDNFYTVNQWNMLLIGEEGTGIFFHNDHLAAASWQGHVAGRKEWIICPYDQSPLLSTELNPFQPDYARFPRFKDAKCGRYVAQEGELIYYPAYWWHTTRCLDRTTIGITGIMVGVEDTRADIQGTVHERFYHDMKHKCANCWPADCEDESCRTCEDISLKWPGAAPPIALGVCKALPSCLKLWDKHVAGLDWAGREQNEVKDEL